MAETTKPGQRAILLLAHGTPDALEDIPAYLSNVVSGRPMPQSVIDEITHRYSLIGRSPLTALTMEQARLLGEAAQLPVYVGMRNWKPYIAETVQRMKADGVTEAVAICLAPQNSRTSVGLYRRAVFAEAAGAIQVDFLSGWAGHPLLVEAFAERLRASLRTMPADTVILFTAHSVPCRTVQAAPPPAADAPWTNISVAPGAAGVPTTVSTPDPYAVECKHTAAEVAAQVPAITDRWCFAFQSQGMAGGPWIGPTVEDTLAALHAGGVRTVLLQTIGFLCDHVEILYDIDIAFREYAEGLGMRFERTESLNGSALLTAALRDLAEQGFARLQHASPAEPETVPVRPSR